VNYFFYCCDLVTIYIHEDGNLRLNCEHYSDMLSFKMFYKQTCEIYDSLNGHSLRMKINHGSMNSYHFYHGYALYADYFTTSISGKLIRIYCIPKEKL